MELKRGRWYKKYINCWEDKRDYDIMRRGYMRAHESIADDYCKRFSPPELTEEEKNEISAYWAQFGIKIYDFSWHRMYYHATQNHDPKFVPDLVAGLVLYEYYNDRAYENTWRDKNMFHRLLPDVPLPKALGRRIRGRYFIDEVGYIQSEKDDIAEFAKLIYGALSIESDIVIKKTRDTGFGKSVSKYHIVSQEDVANTLCLWQDCQDYVVQLCVTPHKIIASLNPSSSNMLRVCSWRHGNRVDILFASARVGAVNSFTDVAFVNGEELVNMVGISNDGYFSEKMVDQNGRFVKELPKNVKIPSWDKITEIIKKNHLMIDNFDIIGWDFTVDEDENPVCFEWNISWPGTVLYQFANGKPLYGDKTEEIFSFLKNEKNKDNYIPYYIRIK